MRIDAHHHLWDLTARDQPWTAGLPQLQRSYALDDLRPELATAGIEATIVVQALDLAAETEELLALAADEPLIAGVVGWVDLTGADVGAELDRLIDGVGGNKLVGIRHGVQAEPDPRWLLGDHVLRGLRAVAERDLTYDLLVKPAQFAAAVEVVRTLPQLRFVLDHGGKPDIAHDGYAAWQPLLSRLAESSHAAVKLSGLITEADHDRWRTADIAPYAAAMINSFGADRVLYGSDWPVCNLAGGYRRVAELTEELIGGLTPQEQQLIMGGSAEHWYRLTGRD